MDQYEILDDAGNVINIIVANTEFLEQFYAGKYRLQQQNIPAPPPPPKIVSKADFRLSLMDAEYVAILSAAKTDIEVQAWVETFNILTEINLDSLRTVSGLEMLVSKGILTESRKNEILKVSDSLDAP